MRSVRPAVVAVLIVALNAPPASLARNPAPQRENAAPAIPYFSEPSVAPDRAEMAFVSGGDIWTAPLAGGDAHLLIAHPAHESRPLYSPDGKRLAFVSTRTGSGDIYLYTFATGDVRRLTFDDTNDQLDAWSRDGKWIYFHASSRDISGMNDIFRISAEGGTPMAVTADRYTNEFFSAPSPDGARLAFSARGNASSQWWRKGHSHLDESEIWLMSDTSPARYEMHVGRGAKNLWPMWSADGKSIYFVRDSKGVQNVWVKPLGGGERQVTRFRDGRVLWPSISYDGRTIVFERDFEIWRLDTGSGQAAVVRLARRSAPPATSPERLSLNNRFSDLALSPDGKKVAFIAHGEVFAAPAKDGGNAVRVTSTIAQESQIAWSPDSKQIVYASERNGVPQLFLFDFAKESEAQLTNSAQDDCSPYFSPDGTMIAFIRNAKEVRVLDMGSKQERLLTTGALERPPFNSARPLAWSSDSKWIAFFNLSGKLFANPFVVSAGGGEARPVSFLSNAFANTLSWSPDGAFLLFDTGQRTETRMLARVDLIPRAPKFREDQFRELFVDRPPAKSGAGAQRPAKSPEAAEKPEKKPVEIVFDDIRRRLSILNVGVDLGYQTISPDGKVVVMVASAAGQQNIYSYSLDELAREPAVARQITTTADFKSDVQFTPDSKELYFLAGGRISIANLENRQVRPLNVTAELDVDFEQEKNEVFAQAWRLQRDNFYDPKYHGVDWNAVRQTYAPRAAGARTTLELRRLLSLMVGELNASHLGATGPTGSPQTPVGKLGLRFDRAEFERAGRLRVTEVIPLGPAEIAGKIRPGEYLLAVEKNLIGPRTNLDELLANTTGRRAELTIASTADGADKRTVAVQPISTGAEKQLLYRQWVAANRAYVEKASGGRLGYAHMPDMGAGSLAQLYVDLDVENQMREGVVIDIRNNNGGFVNVYAIDVLARRSYISMQPRGQQAAPMRTLLGQRTLERATILVTNQHSLSDAEDFTEGYRALKLGKVVGEPTSGWIIYTSNVTLLDGTSFRIPFIRITDSAGKDMELNPRPVDVPVTRPVGETYSAKDSQLDAAIAELLKQIGSKR
jgi:Tol biopolymer transport system component